MAQTRNEAKPAAPAASAEPQDTGLADELLGLEKRYGRQ